MIGAGRILIAVAALLGAANPASSARAQSGKPLWEAGAGMGFLSLPDYRGSDQRHGYALPYPFFIYRGERLSVDRQGMRAKLFDSERLHLDGSFTGNFTLRSANNRAREGMPTLNPLLEVGPELVYTFYRAQRPGETTLDARFATRAAFSLGGGRISPRGFTVSPYLRAYNSNLAGSGFDFSGTFGLLYGSEKYHRYLYTVGPEYATSGRAAYSAPAGYAGTFGIAAAGRRYGNWWVGGYLRYDNLSGASFEASPLVKTRNYLAGGLAVSWIFASSEERGRGDE